MAVLRALSALALVFAFACDGSDQAVLVVDLRTDLLPGVEFGRVDTTVTIGSDERGALPFATSVGESFTSGQRVAEISELPKGTASVRVSLRDGSGAEVASRTTRVQIVGDTGVVVIIGRRCLTTVCPGAGDDPSATECSGGQCVPPTCRSGDRSCGPNECTADGDCATAAACVSGVCASGECLAVADDGSCAADELCDPDRGCVPRGIVPDGGMDTGVVDATTDTIADAPVDSEPLPDSGFGSSLIAWYRFDDDLTDGVFDSSGNGAHGRCRGGCPMQIDAPYGLGIDANSGGYIEVPHHTVFERMSSSFSIAFWSRVESTRTAATFVEKVYAGDSSGMHSFRVELVSMGGTDQLVFETTSTDTPDYLREDVDIAGWDMYWNMIIVMWDGTTKSLFINTRPASTTRMPLSVEIDDGVLLLGAERYGAVTAPLDGDLDEVMIFDRVLTMGEIIDLQGG
jgi:hypothetical protein